MSRKSSVVLCRLIGHLAYCSCDDGALLQRLGVIVSQIFSETPEVPNWLFSKSALGPCHNELQYDAAIHSEADDIAAYIVDTGFTYCEAVVTFASDESMMRIVLHKVLVPLRVLKLLSSRRPLNMPVYASIFLVRHLSSINDLIKFCIKKQLPAHRLFVSDEQPPWQSMSLICSEILDFMRRRSPPNELKAGPPPPKPKTEKLEEGAPKSKKSKGKPPPPKPKFKKPKEAVLPLKSKHEKPKLPLKPKFEKSKEGEAPLVPEKLKEGETPRKPKPEKPKPPPMPKDENPKEGEAFLKPEPEKPKPPPRPKFKKPKEGQAPLKQKPEKPEQPSMPDVEKPIREKPLPIVEIGEPSSEDYESDDWAASGRDSTFPRHFDHVRSGQVGYRRGREQMCVYLREGHVYLKSQPLSKFALGLITKYSIKLGPLGEIGVKRAENRNGGDGGEEDDSNNERMSGLNELIQGVNDGIKAPTKWLLSHVLCGRILGSTADGSHTSWFPRRSPDGQQVYVPLLLRRVTDIVGPLLSDAEGNIALPVMGPGLIGNLRSTSSSIVQVEWRKIDYDEEFTTQVEEVWNNEKIKLC